MDSWPTKRTETVFDCPWFTVGYDEVETPDGETDEYYWVDRPANAIGIVAIHEEDVVMVEQYRPKLKEAFLECPGGHIEDDESYEEAAARELHEETGLIADRCHHLTTYYPTATTRYERAIVVAEALTEGEANPDDSEFISWQYVPIEEALNEATEQPTTGWTLTSLLMARNQGFI